MKLVFVLQFLALFSACLAHSGTSDGRKYEPHDVVEVEASTVGPFNNPSETYPYYSLPFCIKSGKQKSHLHPSNLPDSLSGLQKYHSPYEVTFFDSIPWRMLCEDFLEEEDLKKFRDAIEDDYFFEMYLDGLPMWGYIGEVVHEDFLLGKAIQGSKVYLYPHLLFNIGYNGNQIVSVNVTTDPTRRIDITDVKGGAEVIFSYAVNWVNQPNIKYSHRMKRYDGANAFVSNFEIRWFSIVNSAVLVCLLLAFLAVVFIRILKNEFTKYELFAVDEEDLVESREDSGWKMIHGDVFRAPENLNILCAMVGAGAQLFASAMITLVLVLLQAFRTSRRGALLTVGIVIFAACGFIGGFVSGRLYKQLKGKEWSWNVILTASLMPFPVCLVFSFVHTVAVSANSTAALPTTVILIIGTIIVFVHFPLTLIGAVFARNMTEEYKPPCRTNKVPREVPPLQSWYKHPALQLLMAGFLPFSAIYIELHYIFAAMWGHKIYTLFGVLAVVFVMLTLVTAFITVALLYFQLAREEHHWWWSSFVNGGAIGVFIFCYSFYYLFHRSEMDGFFQLSFYFGYTTLVAYAFFLMLGFVGFMSSFKFVDYIYGVVKTD